MNSEGRGSFEGGSNINDSTLFSDENGEDEKEEGEGEEIRAFDTSNIYGIITEFERKLEGLMAKPEETPDWARTVLLKMKELDSTQSEVRMMGNLLKTLEMQMASDRDDDEGKGGAPTLGLLPSSAFGRVHEDIEARSSSIRTEVEAKLSTINLEVDRLQKLISSRPTVAELSQLKESVFGDLGRVKRNLMESHQQSDRQFSSQIANELGTLSSWRSKQDKLVNTRLSTLNEGVDELKKEVRDTRGFTEKNVISLKTELGDMRTSFGRTLGQLGESIEEIKTFQDGLLQRIESLEEGSKEHGDKLEDLDTQIENDRGETEVKFTQVNVEIEACNEAVEEEAKRVDQIVEDLKDDLNMRCDGLEEKIMDLQGSLGVMDERVGGDEKRIEGVEEFRKFVEGTDVFERVGKLEIEIESSNDNIGTNFDAIQEIHESIKKIVMDVELAREEVKEAGVGEDVLMQIREGIDQSLEHKHLMGTLREDMGIALKQVTRLEDMGKKMGGIVEQHELFADRVETVTQNVMKMEGMVNEHEEILEHLNTNLNQLTTTSKSSLEEARGYLLGRVEHLQGKTEASIDDVRTQSEEGIQQIIFQMEEAAKNALNIGFNVTDDQRESLQKDLVDVLAEVCATFENIADKQRKVPEMPSTLLENIVKAAQDMARAISDTTNYDAIKRTIRSTLDDIVYSEDEVAEFRHDQIAQFERMVLRKAEETTPDPSQFKRDAREKFLNVLDQAMEVALTQFEQVLVMGHTRMGKVSIPTCVACDRPLMEKMRKSGTNSTIRGKSGRPSSQLADQYEEMAEIVNKSYFMHGGDVDEGVGVPQLTSTVSPSVRLPSVNCGPMLENPNFSQSLSSLDQGGELGGMVGSRSASLIQPVKRNKGKEGSFVMRGGFKMPVPIPSDEVIEMIDDGARRRDGIGSRFVESGKLPNVFTK